MNWKEEMMKEVVDRIVEDVELTLNNWTDENLNSLIKSAVASEMKNLVRQITHAFIKEKERSIIARLTPRVYSTLESALDTIVKEIENGR